ncbi:MAG: hypothetical protein CL566_09835 [Alphaproteobacteria bacterium]|nr:hypothetical protein [Alphaproteobacteria bacterium]|tara:strand:- start:2896 stop:3090 length:195 start_codon:yes stop_codon:yes gene_type:complete
MLHLVVLGVLAGAFVNFGAMFFTMTVTDCTAAWRDCFLSQADFGDHRRCGAVHRQILIVMAWTD